MHVLSHVNSDRQSIGPSLPGMVTKLGTEAHPYFYKTLASLGKQKRIDLLLYTSGGQTSFCLAFSKHT